MYLPYTVAYGMAENAYVYIPPRCQAGAKCKLHVAMHGCSMTAALIGFDFVSHAGYNAWADANDIVILFPQSLKTTLNPLSCFDWCVPVHHWRWCGVVIRLMIDKVACFHACVAAQVGLHGH